MITVSPRIGRVVEVDPKLEIRRVQLVRSRYHLYYRVDDAAEIVEIVSLWHQSRGEDPPL